jgi:4-hydroxythreonine-4-phosphate dehydrogenase
LLTQGDPAGIGPEITLKAWLARRLAQLPPFALVGDAAALAAFGARLGLDVPVRETDPEQAVALFDEALPVIASGCAFSAIPGEPDPRSGASTLASIDTAAALIKAQRGAAMVTNPIAKAVLYAAGFSHPGHTEYLGACAQRLWGEPNRPVMLLWCDSLAVVPVTVHVPLSRVPELLTQDLIVETGQIVARDYAARFGVAHPRLAVAGLNPHAGEGGALGLEDDAIIRPAVGRLQALGIAARGPLPADTLFHERARAGYDVALCMYHDQALIPIKTLAFDDGVNVTLGLPFIRTSPDHGTAFDIAGKGVARPDSLIAALRLAGRLSSQAAP